MLFDRDRAVAELAGRAGLARLIVQRHREAAMKRLPVGFACEFACGGVISREEFVVPTLIHRAALSSAPDRVGRRNRYEKLSRFILSDLARHGLNASSARRLAFLHRSSLWPADSVAISIRLIIGRPNSSVLGTGGLIGSQRGRRIEVRPASAVRRRRRRGGRRP
jgi:hypothetical protein